jgi:cytochrome b
MRDRLSGDSALRARIKVWDVPTRLFHWLSVLLVAGAWFSASNNLMALHLWCGILLIVFLTFRLAWGLVGSTTARFSDFITGPKAVLNHFREMGRENPPGYAGHNPAGGWMTLVLLATLAVEAGLGLLANDDLRFAGPLAVWVTKDSSDHMTQLHRDLFGVLLVLIWVHVVAVMFYLLVEGRNLIGPMIHGCKDIQEVPAGMTLRFVSTRTALRVLALSGGIVWWLLL